MEFFIIIVIIFIIGIIIFVVNSLNDASSKKKAMDDYLIGIEDFTTSQKVMGYDNNTGIAIDEQRKKVCLIDHDLLQNVISRIVDYKDLLSCELFEDGITITKTVRSSQLGGALIGGIALGGVGAIIGGLSGKTLSFDKVNRVDLRLIINDTKNPLHDINFMNIETKKDSLIYKYSIQQARHWHGLIEVLIRRADSEEKTTVPTQVDAPSSSSIANEIKKLLDLRDQGALTPQEFQQQKERLLRFWK